MSAPRSPRHRASFLRDADELAPNRRVRKSDAVTPELDVRDTAPWRRSDQVGAQATTVLLVVCLVLLVLAVAASWKGRSVAAKEATHVVGEAR